MLHDVEVHCKQAGLQGGAEGVALHQANLSIGRLMAEQVFLGGNHILQHLKRDLNEDIHQLMWIKFFITLKFCFKIERLSEGISSG